MNGIRKIERKINNYSIETCEITDYCIKRMDERNISEEILLTTLFSEGNLFDIEIQDKFYRNKPDERYKLTFKLSNRYSLIIIISFGKKNLKILNAIKTSKEVRWEWKNTIYK